ncbi:MAG: hypothetical protein FJ279_31055 [Planctomycetes bacterium]|nr:hypothetical protein [Planctomycetota bacterium]
MATRMIMLGLNVALAAALVGCASVDTATKFNDLNLITPGPKPVAHVNGSCWGFYVLNFIPIVSGSTDSPGWPTIFSDTAAVEPVVDMTTRKARQMGASSFRDLHSHKVSIPIVPLFIWIKSCEVSATGAR